MTSKEQFLAYLEPYEPIDAKDRHDRLEMLVYADTLAEPMSRRQLNAHFTGSAIVVHPDQQQVCLVFHGKYQRWIQLGGHGEMEDDGDIAATALREAQEESGLEVAHFGGQPLLVDIDIHTIPARGEEPQHLHLDMRFLIQAKTTDLQIDPNESSDLQWMTWEEAIKRIDVDLTGVRMLKKAQKIVQGASP